LLQIIFYIIYYQIKIFADCFKKDYENTDTSQEKFRSLAECCILVSWRSSSNNPLWAKLCCNFWVNL